MTSTTNEAVAQMLRGYDGIISRFISGVSSADEFETSYLRYFKADENQVTGDEFDVLDSLFADVDDYVSDPSLRESVGGIDEHELRTRAQKAYSRLFPVR